MIDLQLTPDQLPRELFEQPYFFLLETTLPDSRNRWTIAGWNPTLILSSTSEPNLLERLRKELIKETSERAYRDTPLLPFQGGWIGYIGYEFYRFLGEKIPSRKSDLIPEGLFGYYEKFYAYDHEKKKAYRAPKDQELPSWFLRKSQHHSSHVPLVQGFPAGHDSSLMVATSSKPSGKAPDLFSNFSKKAYLRTIDKIKNYITAGDCYQVNLSQRFSCAVKESPYDIYQRLKQISPAPYSAFLNLGDTQIISSSPESFLQVKNKEVTTRPIKGTRPRGKTVADDARLKEELTISTKDRAELLMITDLLRNDLGKVCEKGSIHVPSLCEVESFAQVHHLVSTIQGTLKEDTDVIDLLKATFPGGSITGAPKIRAMEIIHELETVPRNVYTGAIGFISLNGHAEFNIAIRTMVIKEGQAYFWGGGGIVSDSSPEEEYLETTVKVEGLVSSVS
ncbi:MAG: aminodeoxychorismate synthase component I [Deltaproteobacteria bacterium]|nr:aminodeoxychorismate synthase component I [Deltaproteobacteria bacterium]